MNQASEPMCHHLGSLGAGIKGEAKVSELWLPAKDGLSAFAAELWSSLNATKSRHRS